MLSGMLPLREGEESTAIPEPLTCLEVCPTSHLVSWSPGRGGQKVSAEHAWPA